MLILFFLDVLKHEVSDINYMFIVECMENTIIEENKNNKNHLHKTPQLKVNSLLTFWCISFQDLFWISSF